MASADWFSPTNLRSCSGNVHAASVAVEEKTRALTDLFVFPKRKAPALRELQVCGQKPGTRQLKGRFRPLPLSTVPGAAATIPARCHTALHRWKPRPGVSRDAFALPAISPT